MQFVLHCIAMIGNLVVAGTLPAATAAAYTL
jgi:hypothetical protein